MPMHRAHRNAIAGLHRMACLDVGGVEFIEPMLRELQQVVGFDFGAFLYPDGDGELQAYAQEPIPQSAVADYFDARILRSEREVMLRSSRDFAEVVRHEHGPVLIGQMVAVPIAEMRRSDFYNVVLRTMGVADAVSLTLRTPQGQGLGTLKLYRSVTSPAFGEDDVTKLARLEPYLGRILQATEWDAEDSEILSQGLLIASSEGRPLWISPDAEVLMPRAFGWRWRRGAELPPALQELVRRLRAPLEHMVLPTMELRTAQGRFSLRATRMTAATCMHQAQTAVALHITQRVARGMRLLSKLQTLDLPQRQYEMAWWLAKGLTEQQITHRMGISINTAVYHRRQLYNRLDVTNRDMFLMKMQMICPSRLHP